MKRIDPEDLDIPVIRPGERRPPWAGELPHPRSACPICKGAGYLVLYRPSGGVELVPCECKQRELEESDYQELQRLSNLDAFAGKTFESFDPTVAGVEKGYRLARSFAENLSTLYQDSAAVEEAAEKLPKPWLLLMGRPGCGKTHLAAAIAHEAIRRHIKTLFTIVPDLLDHLRASYAPDSRVRFDDRIEAVRTVFLLILDDLGMENATPWAREKLYQIINYRYNHRLPTVITTNQDLDRLEERVRSRIVDRNLCARVFITARDYRQPPETTGPPPSRNRRA